MISSLDRDAAQSFIDVVHEVRPAMLRLCVTRPDQPHLFVSPAFGFSLPTNQALDALDLPPHLRRKCLGGLCWVCGRHALLPKSLHIPLCYDRSDTPLYRGGFGDVWKGEHQGRHVAVKVLKVYSTSDFDKITKVGSHRLIKWVR